MKKYPFKEATFVTSALAPKGYAKHNFPEIAFVGRSNVGKSSLLANLLGSKRLVKISSVPGKTQLINFFCADERLSLVDLPGYGWANVPKKQKEEWGRSVSAYLKKRDELNLILFLLDIRRTPNEDDLQMMQWIVDANKAVILVITKADKVTKAQRKQYVDHILKTFNLENLHYVLYSVPKKIGRDTLISFINEAIADETND